MSCPCFLKQKIQNLVVAMLCYYLLYVNLESEYFICMTMTRRDVGKLRTEFLHWQHFYPFTAKGDKYQNLPKFLNIIYQNAEKQIVPCESTAEEVSFEW